MAVVVIEVLTQMVLILMAALVGRLLWQAAIGSSQRQAVSAARSSTGATLVVLSDQGEPVALALGTALYTRVDSRHDAVFLGRVAQLDESARGPRA